jgi:hypothetical protein
MTDSSMAVSNLKDNAPHSVANALSGMAKLSI